MQPPEEALDSAKVVEDDVPPARCPSPHGQERDPFLARRGGNGQHPFCKAAVSFLALVALHVLLALSFKLAQRKSSGQYPFSSPALLVVTEAAKLVLSVYLLWQEECCARSRSTIEGCDGITQDGGGSGSNDAATQSNWEAGRQGPAPSTVGGVLAAGAQDGHP